MIQHLTPEVLIDYVHGELTPEADASVHVHLAGCAACREQYELEVGVGDALRAAARAGEVEFPSIVAARVWERVRETKPGPFAGLAMLLRPIVAVPLAAALVFGAYFASSLGRPAAHGPTIDATYYLEQHAGQEASEPFSERSSPQVIESSLVDAQPAPAFSGAIDVVR